MPERNIRGGLQPDGETYVMRISRMTPDPKTKDMAWRPPDPGDVIGRGFKVDEVIWTREFKRRGKTERYFAARVKPT
ncbi:hypothetical protein A3D84_02035 [Candidatus Woesebacteria bacterium RIFCSPHIGHO2_02_FULL_42_20]|uniref:Uncharacterized protein n=1 Tax=Candidatus Woesebacteria bacterium RIFCSPHIGHO2_12_FULL_41_24 TaxID=1802510 RepID=A0A1F8AT85_9BACT|nr:MAG: hypothetical protein A2873_04870 [Candidatus Woesebacteria bacterium RIFCSPHIGHO2_01_FULL_42_80]OGM35104.1 MAG: hypothetical protein A3D84_02035 [Candidatus Woesebacteria bacterium RIFCSPHIGHO2_02_FULL_42_20]OGM54840.1 MAG: hypothetical protein A3E44_01635 [Candidatus Woesebacteria bacterium RIFCSPHIGHO2_12_FULL_41_24]OGM67456.1 MAG: hypothetical protein A2969_05485 [Candidatus Woesebacteria bacterium RIFCSPLOWO2_01_FULL_42_67]OGM72140.1 MAG: hypothetical protein A3H21_00715 [Candidatus